MGAGVELAGDVGLIVKKVGLGQGVEDVSLKGYR